MTRSRKLCVIGAIEERPDAGEWVHLLIAGAALFTTCAAFITFIETLA